MKDRLAILHQRDGVPGAISLEVQNAPLKDKPAKRVDYPPDVNSGTLVLWDEPLEVVSPFFRRFWGFRVEDVSILRC